MGDPEIYFYAVDHFFGTSYILASEAYGQIVNHRIGLIRDLTTLLSGWLPFGFNGEVRMISKVPKQIREKVAVAIKATPKEERVEEVREATPEEQQEFAESFFGRAKIKFIKSRRELLAA